MKYSTKDNDWHLIKAAGIIYFLVFILSLLIYWDRPVPYIRPIWYFISLSILAAIVSIQILSIKNYKSKKILVLLEAYFISV
ncbi:hypothetical protein A3L02_07080 [Thermococcus celer Vu 13 = JCM 8558]|uniref:Uncharacterized protein n=1 Tax=Thermococcus celer Vu 13 = JCM 8558 TaxID=1293037 RepID=A0A218P333_THECE|nr:hypothetical protein A3L02_07080 [Thermococcus celer Vu 13 = JCM 8558]